MKDTLVEIIYKVEVFDIHAANNLKKKMITVLYTNGIRHAMANVTNIDIKNIGLASSEPTLSKEKLSGDSSCINPTPISYFSCTNFDINITIEPGEHNMYLNSTTAMNVVEETANAKVNKNHDSGWGTNEGQTSDNGKENDHAFKASDTNSNENGTSITIFVEILLALAGLMIACFTFEKCFGSRIRKRIRRKQHFKELYGELQPSFDSSSESTLYNIDRNRGVEMKQFFPDVDRTVMQDINNYSEDEESEDAMTTDEESDDAMITDKDDELAKGNDNDQREIGEYKTDEDNEDVVVDSNGIIINVEDCIASDDDDNTSCCDKEENIFVKRHNSEVDINDVIVSSTVVNDVGDDEEKILEKEEEEPGQTNERNELNLALYSTSTVNPNNNNNDDGLAMVHNFLLELEEGD